jgi:hypothetical protein
LKAYILFNLEFTMSKITVKSTKPVILAAYEDAIRELELVKRQLVETTTEKEGLMSEVQILKQSYDEVEAKLISVEANTFTRAEVEELIALEVADMATKPPASQPKRPAPKPLPSPAQVEMAPVISITDADKAIWSKFQRLSREERMTIITWARPQFGHIGINNIQAVRAAWHEFNNPTSCADEANLADIA